MKREKQAATTKRRKTGGSPGPPDPRDENLEPRAAARMAQAEAEDAADASWLAECQKIQSRVESERPGLPRPASGSCASQHPLIPFEAASGACGNG